MRPLLPMPPGSTMFDGALRFLAEEERRALDADPELKALFDLGEGTYFAEDAFGDLFHAGPEGIRKVLLSVDDVEDVCPEAADFLPCVQADPDYLVGAGFLAAWLDGHGPLKKGCRLSQVIPLLFSGEFALDNFKAVPAGETRAYAMLMVRTAREVPEGGKIELVVGADPRIERGPVGSASSEKPGD